MAVKDYCKKFWGLNPCCSGIWSLTQVKYSRAVPLWGLNPCCSGIWSLTNHMRLTIASAEGLNPCCSGIWSLTWTIKPPITEDNQS